MIDDTATGGTDDAGSDAGGSGDAGQGDAGRVSGRTFTQADVDRIAAERVNRSKSQFKDYDELKQKAAQLAKLEAANQTDTERLQKERDEAQAAAEAATERETAALERANDTLRRAAVVSAAAGADAIDPEDVYALLDRSKLTVADDGTVKGAKEAVEKLLKEKPHLKRSGRGGFDGGARDTAGGQPDNMNDRIRSGFSTTR